MKTLLIKNGYIVTENEVVKGDLLIEEDKIIEISDFIDKKADKIIDANNNIVFPGSIDAHTHMELPLKNGFSSDTFETGTRAALFGGTTTIIDFANQEKGNTLDYALKKWHEKAKRHCHTDYKFHVSVTDVNEKTLTEMENLYECHGIKSFKTFLAYPHMEILPEDLKRVMDKAKSLGAITTLHAETGHLIEHKVKELCENQMVSPSVHPISHPDQAEEDAIAQALHIAEETEATLYIVHLTSKKGLDLIREAKQRQVSVLAETCPQYLLLTDTLYEHDNPDTPLKYILSPPLRKKEDLKALWEGVMDKTIDVIATDHCPFMMEQKRKGKDDFRLVPNGIPGVENRFEIMFSECVNKRKMPLHQFSQIMTTNPSKIFKMYPQKGVIKVGSDADLIILDKDTSWKISKDNHHMNVDYNPYEGLAVTGKVKTTILRGNVLIEDEKLVNNEKLGEFIY